MVLIIFTRFHKNFTIRFNKIGFLFQNKFSIFLNIYNNEQPKFIYSSDNNNYPYTIAFVKNMEAATAKSLIKWQNFTENALFLLPYFLMKVIYG